jgi:hypothetical protein
MATLKQMDNILKEIKGKLSNLRSQRQINRYLNSHKESAELSLLHDLTSALKYTDIAGLIDRSNIQEDEISYQNLLDDAPHYSVGLFFFPKGSYIPLHDHLNLLVFSKVLTGTLHIASYDKVNERIKDVYDNFYLEIILR